MSVIIGNPQEQKFAATALGAATGLVTTLSNSGWCLLGSVLLTYVASGSGGSRIVVVDFKDPAGAILWRSTQGTAITSGQTSRLGFGGGIPSASITSPIVQYTPLPIYLFLPVNTTMTVFDSADIDHANDTVAANIIFSN